MSGWKGLAGTMALALAVPFVVYGYVWTVTRFSEREPNPRRQMLARGSMSALYLLVAVLRSLDSGVWAPVVRFGLMIGGWALASWWQVEA